MNCVHCGVTVKDQQGMDEHVAENHPDKKLNTCDSCGTYFHSIRSQVLHKCKSKTKKKFQEQTNPKKPKSSKKSPEDDVKSSQWWCCHCEKNYFGILTKKIYELHMTNFHENIQEDHVFEEEEKVHKKKSKPREKKSRLMEKV